MMVTMANRTHIDIKVHEVGHHFDIGVVDTSLFDNFLQHISQTRWKDKHWNAVRLQSVKELLIPFPVTCGRTHAYDQFSERLYFTMFVLLGLQQQNKRVNLDFCQNLVIHISLFILCDVFFINFRSVHFGTFLENKKVLN